MGGLVRTGRPTSASVAAEAAQKEELEDKTDPERGGRRLPWLLEDPASNKATSANEIVHSLCLPRHLGLGSHHLHRQRARGDPCLG